MSAPYPRDLVRAREDRDRQPYEDARQALGEKEARLQAQAEAYGEERQRETDEERAARLNAEAAARLRAVGDEAAEPAAADRPRDQR